MRCAPRATNISPTTDFPDAIPPVRPTFSKLSPQENPRPRPGGTEKIFLSFSIFAAALCLYGESLSFDGHFRHTAASPHLRRFHGVIHQHRNGQRTDSTGNRRQRSCHFGHLRVHIADQRRSLRTESFFPLATFIQSAAEQALEDGRISH